MSGRLVAIALSLLAATTCAAAEQPKGTDETEFVPHLLSGSGSANSPGLIFAKALPVSVSVYASYIGADVLGPCDVEPDAFDPIVLEALKRHGIEVNPDAALLLEFHASLLDAPGGQCYVIIDNSLQAASLIKFVWAPDETFRHLTILLENQYSYLSPPERIADTFKAEVEERLRPIAPTIRGEVEKNCGYFHADPDAACEDWFRSILSVYTDALACMRSEEETAIVKQDYARLYPEFWEWLSERPEEARPGANDSPGEAQCERMRRGVIGRSPE